MLKKAFQREEFRFLAVGSANTAWGIISYPIYFWIFHQFGLNYLIIVVITYVLNGSISYITQKYIVFRTVGNHIQELWKYFAFQLSILGLNLLVLPVAVQIFEVNPVIAQTIFVAAVVITTYFFHKFVTFRNKKNRSHSVDSLKRESPEDN